MLPHCLVIQRGMHVTPLGFCLKVIVNRSNKSWQDDFRFFVCIVINLWDKTEVFSTFCGRKQGKKRKGAKLWK